MSLSISEDQIRNELKTVLDPETHLNIVEMGFIRKVQVIPTDDAFQIRIVYTLTTPGCPLAGMIQHQVQQALTRIIPDELLDSKKIQPEKDIITELTFDPPWRLQDMSEEARAELGF